MRRTVIVVIEGSMGVAVDKTVMVGGGAVTVWTCNGLLSVMASMMEPMADRLREEEDIEVEDDSADVVRDVDVLDACSVTVIVMGLSIVWYTVIADGSWKTISTVKSKVD